MGNSKLARRVHGVQKLPNVWKLACLHFLGQKGAVSIMRDMSAPDAKIFIGWLRGALYNGPLALRGYLWQTGQQYSYEDSRALLRFAQRLLNALQRESLEHLKHIL